MHRLIGTLLPGGSPVYTDKGNVIGGRTNENIRGFRGERYNGRASLYNNFEVRLRLFKGAATVIGRSSPWALYSEDLASFDSKSFDQSQMTGADAAHGLQARMYHALRDQRK